MKLTFFCKNYLIPNFFQIKTLFKMSILKSNYLDFKIGYFHTYLHTYISIYLNIHIYVHVHRNIPTYIDILIFLSKKIKVQVKVQIFVLCRSSMVSTLKSDYWDLRLALGYSIL